LFGRAFCGFLVNALFKRDLAPGFGAKNEEHQNAAHYQGTEQYNKADGVSELYKSHHNGTYKTAKPKDPGDAETRYDGHLGN
jgi:hypothetical protein